MAHAFPPLSAEQARAVQHTVALVLPQGERLAALFYARLFALDPGARALFRGDLAAQGRKFMEMLDVVAGDPSRLGELGPALRRLGERHADYGVRAGQYEVVGEALLWALERALGREFTPAARRAWAAAYALMVDAMLPSPSGGADSP